MKTALKNFTASFSSEKISETLTRFALPLLQVVALSLLLCFSVEKTEYWNERWFVVSVYYLATGAVLSFGLQLWQETASWSKKGKYILFAVLQLAWLVNSICLFLTSTVTVPTLLGNVSLCIFICICTLSLPFSETTNDTPYWNFGLRTLTTFIISFFIGALLYGGLSLILAMLNILFDISIESNLYAHFAILALLLFSVFLFLVQQPKPSQIADYTIHSLSIINIFARYILAPLLCIYTLILYVYAIRILIAWELPNGWVSYPISILFIGSVLLVILLYPVRQTKENRYNEWLCRWLPLIILPLLVLMSIGIGRRLSDYGITIARLYLLTFNLWCYAVAIYLFITRSQRIKWLFFSLSFILVLASIGPWSFANITYNKLKGEALSIIRSVSPQPKLPMDKSELTNLLAKLSPKEKNTLLEKLYYISDTYEEGALNDIVKENVSISDFYYSQEDDLPREIVWSFGNSNEEKQFIPIPQDFKEYIVVNSNYCSWKAHEIQSDTISFKLSFQLKETKQETQVEVFLSQKTIETMSDNASSFQPILVRTNKPNLYFYLTEVDLVKRLEEEKPKEIYGTIDGLLLRK